MIHVLITGNRQACNGLLIIALSYMRYNDGPITIHFMTMDHHEANPSFVPPSPEQFAYVRDLLKTHNKESDLIVHDMTKAFHETNWHKKFNKWSYTPYALLRLFCDYEELPDRLLYLDTDTFILGDIKPLYETEMEDYEFAACYDQLGTFWISAYYQNSGVLLLNIPRIKETGLMKKCRDFLSTRRPILADQDALNSSVLKKKFLPQIYNEQKHSHEDTVIRHFSKTLRWIPFFHTLNVKPWHVDRLHKVDDPERFKDILDEFQKRIQELMAL